MPVEINADQVRIQQLEVDVNGPDDVNKMFIINGQAAISLNAQTYSNSQNQTRDETFKIKLDPHIKNTEFRRAIGNAHFNSITLYDSEDTTQYAHENVNWQISDVDADYDDESEQVELRVSVHIAANGESTGISAQNIGFSVTTLASMSEH